MSGEHTGKLRKEKSSKGHKARVKKAADRFESYDHYTQAPFALGRHQDRDDPAITHWSYGDGKWIRPDKRDQRFSVIKELQDSKNMGVSQYGQIMAPEDTADYLIAKKEQQKWAQEMELAGYMIDNDRPETQDLAYQYFPELKTYPDDAFNEQVALQITLRDILRDGQIKGPADNALIFRIIHKDFTLPFYPLWDPQGTILKDIYGKMAAEKIREALTKEGIKKGLFNPRTWAKHENAMAEAQSKVKGLILKRLYPGLRKMDANDAEEILGRLGAATNHVNIGNLSEGRALGLENGLMKFKEKEQ